MAFAWKNSDNAAIGGVGYFFSLHALKSLNSICATFNDNLYTTVISFYCPTDASNETDIITFYNELCSLVWFNTKPNILMISGDMNAQIGKDRNNEFCLLNLPNRNSEHLADFSLKIWKRGGGKALVLYLILHCHYSQVHSDKEW